MPPIKLAILASGSGSNAENIVKYFQSNPGFQIELIASNNPDAFVFQRAKKLKVPTFSFNSSDLRSGKVNDHLLEQDIDFVILAGFLLLIPTNMIRSFSNKIINIHPALLPKYGGKGMYGAHVHEAVITNKERTSGISIHLVNEQYDKGKILFQKSCEVTPTDDAKTLAAKVHELEYEHYPKVIENYILSQEMDGS